MAEKVLSETGAYDGGGNQCGKQCEGGAEDLGNSRKSRDIRVEINEASNARMERKILAIQESLVSMERFEP
jgi:hypothetical protein